MSLVLFDLRILSLFFFFFFNDTATTEIYTLSLHDALPIFRPTLVPVPVHPSCYRSFPPPPVAAASRRGSEGAARSSRSEEHTSELQSPCNLVCRLLLEKKKNRRFHLLTSHAIDSHLTYLAT